MQVTINGTVRILDEGLTIAQLLVQLGKNPKFLAVERNYQLVPRTKHVESPLAEGDVLEIVTLVGGG
jgi:sulfur carrier protein